MTKEQRHRLRKLAEAATPGPRRSDCILPPEHKTRLEIVRTDDNPPSQIICDNCYSREGQFIAACDRETILWLLDYVDEVEDTRDAQIKLTSEINQ